MYGKSCAKHGNVECNAPPATVPGRWHLARHVAEPCGRLPCLAWSCGIHRLFCRPCALCVPLKQHRKLAAFSPDTHAVKEGSASAPAMAARRMRMRLSLAGGWYASACICCALQHDSVQRSACPACFGSLHGSLEAFWQTCHPLFCRTAFLE